MPKQRAPHSNQSWAAAVGDSQQRQCLGHQTTFKDAAWEESWLSQQRLCSAQPFVGGVWEKEHKMFALHFWKGPVLVKLKGIFDKRWPNRSISKRKSVSLRTALLSYSKR